MDKNGYNDSLFETVYGQCYICRKYNITARHEVFPGNPGRKNSKRLGLWVYVCPKCHELLHKDKLSRLSLQCEGQHIYEKTHTDFMDIFGRDYIAAYKYEVEHASEDQEEQIDIFGQSDAGIMF